MITKILLQILATLRHQKSLRRSQSRLQKRFEWQSEFLFAPEKPPLGRVSPLMSLPNHPEQTQPPFLAFHKRAFCFDSRPKIGSAL
jgi:hypothetical protein